MSADFFRRLARGAARRYGAHDRYARHFAFGKLTRDPVFRHLLEDGLMQGSQRVLDLGCGQGLLAALLAAATERRAAGDWPAQWPPPPALSRLHGIDLLERDVARARAAAGTSATFACGDIRTSAFGSADAVVILDVLHYIDPGGQDDVLQRSRAALSGGGVLLLRVADASRGLRWRLTLAADRLAMRLKGLAVPGYHCRPLAAWKARLAAMGFRVEARPMSAGTPFANMLLVAHC